MPTDSHLVTLSSVAAMVIGLVTWILKSALPNIIAQYRADVFQMQKDHREQLDRHADECRTERAEDRQRQDREMAKRDERLQQITEVLMRVTDAYRASEEGSIKCDGRPR